MIYLTRKQLKCYKEKGNATGLFKDSYYFFFQADFVHSDSAWGTGTYRKVRYSP